MKDLKLRRYHAPVWSEPVIMAMGQKGERGIRVPGVDEEIANRVGQARSLIPDRMRRKEEPRLPELSQPHVLRHYLRLSQQTLGMETGIDISEGTCTMKYSPKVNEQIARSPQVLEVHPLQDEETLQGILEIVYRFDRLLQEISGMDAFSFQPGGGSHATYTNACVFRKYHDLRGELKQRREIITTVFSHPCNAATAATAGFDVITLMPDNNGYPDLEALKAVVSERTAGLMMTNPEDTGIYNPRIDEFVRTVHDAGGLCFYDQANANGILGIARAREAGFDACHFNLHKTFSSPHGCEGPACGAYGVRGELTPLLPVPVVTFDGEKYHLDDHRSRSIGKIRSFLGNLQCVVKAYAWTMSMGAEGLVQVAETSVLNNNYLEKMLLEIKGVTKPYAEGKTRLDQVRYSLEKLKKETGIGTCEVQQRMVDFGIQSYWMSHHPWIVPEPFTPEPCETYSKEDCEYWAAVIRQACEEAYADPDTVVNAPHHQTVAKIRSIEDVDDPNKWAMTWRAFQRKSKHHESDGSRQR